MNNLNSASEPLASNAADLSVQPKPSESRTLKRLWGGFLVLVGYLLSPLCWWNDLVINLPIALAFGYALSWFYPPGLVPFTIAGYWLSNVVGMVLMQQGTMGVLRPDAEQNPRKAFVNGLLTSTLYTALIVGLLQLKVVEMPDIFAPDVWVQVSDYLPSWLPLS
ncbi:MAG TPA: hypothetical protein V6D06_11010 [Trichocoleus sp.]